MACVSVQDWRLFDVAPVQEPLKNKSNKKFNLNKEIVDLKQNKKLIINIPSCWD